MSKIRIEIEEQDLIDLLLYTSELDDNASPALLHLHDILMDKLDRIIKHRAYTPLKRSNFKETNLDDRK